MIFEVLSVAKKCLRHESAPLRNFLEIKLLFQLTFQSQYLRNLFLSIIKKLTDIFNSCIRGSTFPEILKKSEVTPVF